MKITTMRKGNTHLVLLDGKWVGEVTTSGPRGFGLHLRGVYWTKEGPNKRGGSSGRVFPRLKDCVEAVAQWFDANPPVETILYTREEVTEAWVCLRRFNNTIPSECLDQMRAVLLLELS